MVGFQGLKTNFLTGASQTSNLVNIETETHIYIDKWNMPLALFSYSF